MGRAGASLRIVSYDAAGISARAGKHFSGVWANWCDSVHHLRLAQIGRDAHLRPRGDAIDQRGRSRTLLTPVIRRPKPNALLTPKALANSSPGFERSENPGNAMEKRLNPERVRRLANPFRVK